MNHEEELKICDEASQGDWELLFEEREDKLYTLRRVQDKKSKRAIILTSATDCDDDYKFIAHFNPKRVRELLEAEQKAERLSSRGFEALHFENKELRHERDELKEALKNLLRADEMPPSDMQGEMAVKAVAKARELLK